MLHKLRFSKYFNKISISTESKKKKTKKAAAVSEGVNGTDTLKTFIDSIIMKAEDSDVKIKRTRSARKPEERKENDPKQNISKNVFGKYLLIQFQST